VIERALTERVGPSLTGRSPRIEDIADSGRERHGSLDSFLQRGGAEWSSTMCDGRLASRLPRRWVCYQVAPALWKLF
jgi:hypothetical protein